MATNWSEKAIEIVQRFDAEIVPLIKKNQPAVKLSKQKFPDYPAERLPSQDPDIIKRWAKKYPGYGVIPGKKFLIIDVDVKDDPSKGKQHGKECIQFLLAKGLPKNTFSVKTPSGGLHLYYQHPNHYSPIQGVDCRVAFEDLSVSQEWEAMRSLQGGSSGIDTRYGIGYVAGPLSDFDGKKYEIHQDLPMANIPSSICVGVKSDVTVSSPKAINKSGMEEIEPGSVSLNRNDHARDWTFRLSMQRLPDVAAKLMIKEAVGFYDNSDGEAPTFDIMWDMYERAKDKDLDVVPFLLNTYIFLVVGRRALNVETGEVVKIEELYGEYTGKMVPQLSANGSVKMTNPVKIWETSPDRVVVSDTTFDIGRQHGVVEVKKMKGTVLYYNRFMPPIDVKFSQVDATPMGEEIAQACINVINNIVSSPYDRDWFRKWIGQMLFDCGTRPAWHWHIFSNARGIGKDTLASIITKLYGESNVARFGTEAFEDKSNIEFFNVGLGIMSDFAPLSGQGGRSKTLAQFKSLTGAATGRMRAMYMDGQQKVISLRFLMLSNSYNDFPVDNNDRRLFKCESKGVKLHPRQYALAHCFTDPDRVTEEMIEQYSLNFNNDDLLYAQALILDYFRTSGYEEMSSQFDCPQNDIKEENAATTEPKYFQDIRRAIEHEIFVFASSIVTRDSLALFLESIKVTTSPDNVLRDLLDKKMLHKMVRRTTRGSTRAFNIKCGLMVYDEDMGRISVLGKETVQNVYCCRDEHHWCNIDAPRRPKEELMKIVGYPNIKNGWNEKTANMLKTNIVPIE